MFKKIFGTSKSPSPSSRSSPDPQNIFNSGNSSPGSNPPSNVTPINVHSSSSLSFGNKLTTPITTPTSTSTLNSNTDSKLMAMPPPTRLSQDFATVMIPPSTNQKSCSFLVNRSDNGSRERESFSKDSLIKGGRPVSPSLSEPTMNSYYRFNDFTLFRTLGTGSFGRVNLVQYTINGNFYAIKKMKKSEILRLRQVEHTNTERDLLCKIDNPFIVKLVCTFQDPRHLYLVMEYVSGGELFSLLRGVRTLPPFVAIFYAAEIVLAIEYLHSKDIIYRDLKPENILLTRDGHVKITDFGFAKVVPDHTWTLCGTPDYLAPEIVLSKGYGKAVDWYTLGILIYEMLIGGPPFYHENQVKLYENIVQKTPQFPRTFDPIAKDLIVKLLEKDPKCRLGALAGGAIDVRSHPWFKDIDWNALSKLQIKPPYKPKVSGDGDDSNYDKYPDEEPDNNPIDESKFEGLFPSF